MLCVRPIPQKEKDQLYELLEHPDPQVRKRAKAVLLSSEGYSANEMVLMVNLTAKSIRKWLRRFNEEGVEGLTRERKSPGPPVRISKEQRRRMVEWSWSSPHLKGWVNPSPTGPSPSLRNTWPGTGRDQVSRSWLWKILEKEGVSLQEVDREPRSGVCKKGGWRDW